MTRKNSPPATTTKRTKPVKHTRLCLRLLISRRRPRAPPHAIFLPRCSRRCGRSYALNPYLSGYVAVAPLVSVGPLQVEIS